MIPQPALKSALEDIFRNFAYLDLQARPDAGRSAPHFSMCAQVMLGATARSSVALFLTGRAAVAASDNFVGHAATEADREDVVRELANVIAGAVRSMLDDDSLQGLGTPRLLPAEAAGTLWSTTPPADRLLLADEEHVQAAVVLNLARAPGKAMLCETGRS
ncbi:MAG TPA: hypothetical protein VGP72_20290 [Planctomycetota bacterium]|jgi:hypothetical protein